MSKTFLALHEYLKSRYSDVAFLTFAQMEDLLEIAVARGGQAGSRVVERRRRGQFRACEFLAAGESDAPHRI